MVSSAISSTWERNIAMLRTFIANHPNIEIMKDLIVIPAIYRKEFYNLFDMASTSFLANKFKEEIAKAKSLSKSYTGVEKAILSISELKNIKMLSEIDLFLHRPDYAIARKIKQPLFDLLSNDISEFDFKEKATKIIEESLKKLDPDAYVIWSALSLINLLEPDRFFRVSLFNLQFIDNTFHDGMEKQVPIPEKTDTITFEHANAVFIVADIIFFSELINQYVAIKVRPAKASTQAETVTSKKEWLELNKNAFIKPDILVYFDKKLDNLNLIADSTRVLKPDLLIECIDVNSILPQRLDGIINTILTFPPTIQTFLLSVDRIGLTQTKNNNEFFDNPSQNNSLTLLTTGYDSSTLKSITRFIEDNFKKKQ